MVSGVHWRERRVEMVVLALAALWIANRSMDSPNTYYDTGMYHYSGGQSGLPLCDSPRSRQSEWPAGF